MFAHRTFYRAILPALFLITISSCTDTASPRMWREKASLDEVPRTQAPVASVTITVNPSTLTRNQSVQATAVAKDAGGNIISGKTVSSWWSGNNWVAMVSSTGVVTATGAGSTSINALIDGVRGATTVTVVNSTNTTPTTPVASVTVSLTASTIPAGQTTQGTAVTRDSTGNTLTGRAITWSSSNPSIATVNSSGLVTGVAAGTVSIVATSEGKTGSAQLNVTSASGGSGMGTLTGTIFSVNGSPAGGGVVELLSGTTVVQTATVNSSGMYSMGNVSAGAHVVRLQPSLRYSLGPSEPAQRTVTVSSTGTTTQNFTVQPALYADDFQTYSTSQLVGGDAYYTSQIPSGYFFSGPNRDISISGKPRITMDLTGGPFGDRAARYDWAANPYTGSTSLSAYCAGGPTISLIPRFNPPPAIQNLWIRFTSKESSQFEHGSSSCLSTAALAYKFFLVQIYNSTSFAQYGTYLGNSVSGQALPTGLYANMTDRANITSAQKGMGGSGSSWGGTWHTWVIELLGVGASSTTFNVYMDGVLQLTLSGPVLPGRAIGTGWALALDIGGIINNGPDHAQSRWFRELGVYTTRPSMRPLVP
jgi:hypothetical protein